METILVILAFHLALRSIAFGCMAYVILRLLNWRRSLFRLTVFAFLLLTFLRLAWEPAFEKLDLKITTSDKEIVRENGSNDLTKWIVAPYGLETAGIDLVQAFVGAYAASRIARSIRRREKQSAPDEDINLQPNDRDDGQTSAPVA